ncbi:MAG: competence protein ComK [Bacillaceae bacterium]
MEATIESKKELVMDYYIIGDDTMMIAAVTTEGGKVISRVYEKERDFIVTLSPLKLIMNSCRHYGSTFRGRIERAKEVTGYTYKTPIALKLSNSLFFFPTHSASNKKCIWVSHAWIKEFREDSNSKAVIVFKNEIMFSMPVSVSSLKNQFLRTIHLRMLIENQPLHKNIELMDNFIIKEFIKKID